MPVSSIMPSMRTIGHRYLYTLIQETVGYGAYKWYKNLSSNRHEAFLISSIQFCLPSTFRYIRFINKDVIRHNLLDFKPRGLPTFVIKDICEIGIMSALVATIPLQALSILWFGLYFVIGKLSLNFVNHLVVDTLKKIRIIPIFSR
jgi:hypothetical protein